MFYISNNCSTVRDIPCVVQNYISDLTGELWPQTHINCSLVQHCVCILQAISYIAIWCATTYDNTTTHVVHNCSTHQTMALQPVMHHFIQTNLTSCTTYCSVFPIIVHTNLRINEVLPYFFIGLASTNVLVHCNKFAAKQQKEEHKPREKFSIKMNHKQGWACKKYRNKRGMKTQEDYLPYYRNIMVKKGQRTTQILLHSQATDVEQLCQHLSILEAKIFLQK